MMGGILVIGDFDGGEFPVGQVVECFQLAIGEDENGNLLIFFKGLLSFLVKFANINFAEIQLSGTLINLS
jgi:hypothetical protein